MGSARGILMLYKRIVVEKDEHKIDNVECYKDGIGVERMNVRHSLLSKIGKNRKN